MKKYIEPELEIKTFSVEDIVTTSGVGNDDEDMGGWH